ncbi:TPA: hypothetical protein U2L38_005454, partial [Burkholderia multivorans]|nr:hypothetical protein [Burkholderia multivorans]
LQCMYAAGNRVPVPGAMSDAYGGYSGGAPPRAAPPLPPPGVQPPPPRY